MLLLLFAQPFNRIAALRLDDVTIDDAQTVMIRLGGQPMQDPPNHNTATNLSSGWLFPGGRPQSHYTEKALQAGVVKMGVDPLATRTAAMRQLVMSCPPAVVAQALGFTFSTTDRHADLAGSRWASYASKVKRWSPSRAET